MQLVRFHQGLERDKGRRRVADGKDAGLGELCGPLHRDDGACDAARFCLRGNVRIGHEAVDFPAEGGQNGLVDAGLRHLRIGDDVAAGAQRLDPLRDRVVGEDEIVGIVKVGSRVDGALDDELVFRVELTVSQQLGDDLEAAALNVHRSDLFQHGVSPFGTRPESGRQRMDSRKNGNADSPRRGCPWRRRTASCGRRASPP